MANVTKPPVLDETHRLTSDQTKNIADVIADGLSNIALGNNSYTKTETDNLLANKADTATTIAGYGITDAYTKSETDGLINALDYSDTAVSGSYVTEVDETDGVIAVTRESADATPTDSSTKMVTSGGVYTALDLKQNALTAGDGIDITSDVISVDAEEKTTTSTFNTVNGGLLSSCVVTLEPVQSGSGTPSPTNIRPITGHTTATVELTDGVDTDTYSTPLNQTVYGGTVDLVSGEMTLTKASYTFDSSESWENALIGGLAGYRSHIFGDVDITGSGRLYEDLLCSKYEPSDSGDDLTCFIYANNGRLYVRDDTYTDIASFTTASVGMQIVYKLATPITIQLSKQQIKTLIGSNTITAPLTGQSVSATYREVMGYDSVEQSMEIKVSLSSLGTVEDSNLSSQAYSSGDYFVRNGQMCKATTAIASGATLAEGTNYTAYTLADILDLLPSSSSSSHIYSSSEQVVGEWVDGKPMYERTLTYTTPSQGSWVDIPIDTTGYNMEHFMFVAYSLDLTQYSAIFASPSLGVWFKMLTSTGQIQTYFTDSQQAGKTAYLTFRYTKTTD